MRSERGFLGLGVVALAAALFFLLSRGFGIDTRSRTDLPTQSVRSQFAQSPVLASLPTASDARAGSVPKGDGIACGSVGRRITITVTDAVSGTPLERASVELLRDSQRVQFTADENGELLLDAHELVDAGVVARAPGHFLAGLSPDAVRAATQVEDRVALRLAPSAALGVWVVDDRSGAPVANARISVHVADPVTRARGAQPYLWPHFVGANRVVHDLISDTYVPAFTDANGWCRIASVPVGTLLRVSADETVEPCSDVVAIAPSTSEAEVRLVGRTSCRVTGRLLLSDGTPLAGVGVRASGRAEGGTHDRYARTLDDGRFVLIGTARGENHIELEGVESPEVSFHCDGGQIDLGDIRLGELGELSGTVSFGPALPAGRMPPALTVKLERAGSALADASVDAQGRFRVKAAPGPCRIVVSSGAHVYARIDAVVPVHDMLIDATAWFGGIRLVGAPAVYDPGFELRLRIEDDADRGDSALVAVRAGPGHWATIVDGEWRAWPIRPSRYQAVVRLASDSQWHELGPAQVVGGAMTVLSLAGSDDCIGGVDVRVEDDEARAVEGLEIVCALAVSATRDEPGVRRVATTDADGRVAFRGLQCGSWIVAPASLGVSGAGSTRAIVSRGDPQTVALVSATPLDLVVDVTEKGSAVRGARVTVRPRAEMFGQASARTLLTDDRGRAEFPRLAPGDYSVACVHGRSGGVFNQSQFVRIGGDGEHALHFDVACDGLRLVVRDGSSLVGDVISASLFSATGIRKAGIDRHTGAIEACVEPGAWIALLTRGSDHASFHSSKSTAMTIATLDVPYSIPGGELTAEVGRGSIAVRLGGASRRPRVQITSARGVGLQLAPGEFPPLAGTENGDGEFVVTGLPVPCRVLIRGDASESGSRASLEVEVPSVERVAVDWPPRR